MNKQEQLQFARDIFKDILDLLESIVPRGLLDLRLRRFLSITCPILLGSNLSRMCLILHPRLMMKKKFKEL
jgi:hypothetical protein